jgi:hypothetical protein
MSHNVFDNVCLSIKSFTIYYTILYYTILYDISSEHVEQDCVQNFLRHGLATLSPDRVSWP